MPRLALVLLLAGCAHGAPKPAPFTVHRTGEGRAVLLIPDLAMPAEVWSSTVEHLAARYRVEVLDVAGFAGNPPIDGPLMPQLRDAVIEHLRQEKLEGAVLVGMLFGGTVAFWVAETAPELVAGVVAIDTPVSRFDGTLDPEAEEGRAVVANASPERFRKMLSRRYAQLLTDQTVAQRLAERAARSSQPAMAEAFYDEVTRDLRPGTTSIRARVLSLLTTENVPEASWAETEKAFRDELAKVPSAELVVVKGAHHYLMYDAPERYLGELDRFLTSLP